MKKNSILALVVFALSAITAGCSQGTATHSESAEVSTIKSPADVSPAKSSLSQAEKNLASQVIADYFLKGATLWGENLKSKITNCDSFNANISQLKSDSTELQGPDGGSWKVEVGNYFCADFSPSFTGKVPLDFIYKNYVYTTVAGEKVTINGTYKVELSLNQDGYKYETSASDLNVDGKAYLIDSIEHADESTPENKYLGSVKVDGSTCQVSEDGSACNF